MNTLLEKNLLKVAGGKETLAALKKELTEGYRETEALRNMRKEERLMHLERSGEARRGTGRLPEGFWELPMPQDPTDSVRQALEEDRG